MTSYLIGVDDADSLKSPTTGELIRQLAESLKADGLAEPRGVTRHQLLVKKKIPYTAHNSAICMSIDGRDMDALWEFARDYLALECERHSNPGLCIGPSDGLSHEVMSWGRRAKSEVLTVEEAQQVAAKARLRLVQIAGNGSGMIGALAAVGLHHEGNDGRFIWLPGLLDLQGTCSVRDILERSAIDRVCSLEHAELPIDELVELTEWTRPLLRDGQATLYVEQKKERWAVLDKERIKELSS